MSFISFHHSCYYYCLLSTIHYCYWWWRPWSWHGFWARSSWGDIQTNLWQVRPHQLICQIQCHSLRLNGRFQGRSTPFCYFSHWFHDISIFHHLSPVLFNKMEQAALVMPNSVLCIQSLANPGCEHFRAVLPYHSTEFQLISYGDGSKPWYLVNPKIAGIYGCSSH